MTIHRLNVQTGQVEILNEDAPDFRKPVTARQVKAEAERRILSIIPEWQQRNLIARAAELAIKGPANWTVNEKAEVTAGQAVWNRVKAIRAASNILEALAPIPMDYESDSYWPE